MDQVIRIKPHHFIDIVTDIGAGETDWQPHPYGHLVHAVASAILADHEVVLEMDFGADDICRPCVHNIGGLCDDTIDISYRPAAPRSKRQYNLLLDRRWSERLGLTEGDRLTAREFCRLTRDRSGDITTIYREIPAERTRKRAEQLRKGVERLLGE
jgi:hypothetical protein